MKNKLVQMMAFLGVMTCSCAQQGSYVINGKIQDGNPLLYLTAVNETGKLDTLQQIKPENGVFKLEGKLEKPRICFLLIEGGKGRIPLVMEDTVFTVDIRENDLTDVRNYTTQGGELQNRKEALNRKEIEIFQERDSVLARYYKAEKEHDIWGKMHEMAGLQVMEEIYDQEENACIAANHDNLLGVCLVYYRYKFLNFEKLKPKFDKLSEEMKNTPEGKLVGIKYKILSEVKTGAMAPNFKLPGNNGEMIHLYGKGAPAKIVDFWASWCGPCRKENPHLVEVYKKYKDKGLLMIGISMDTDEKAWKTAIEADGLEWIQVCDFKGTAGEVARSYQITGIPHLFILDGNNRIVAEGVRGEEIDKVLDKYLK